jgi:hypothetical protein
MSVPDDMIRPWHAHIELGSAGSGKYRHFLDLFPGIFGMNAFVLFIAELLTVQGRNIYTYIYD